jgi:hypothetical protein
MADGQRSQVHPIKLQNFFIKLVVKKQLITKVNSKGFVFSNLHSLKSEALATFRDTEHFQT